MKFFDYREYMKNHSTAVFTGLDEECRRNAPGRQFLRDARAGKSPIWVDTIAPISEPDGDWEFGELQIARFMRGTDAATAGGGKCSYRKHKILLQYCAGRRIIVYILPFLPKKYKCYFVNNFSLAALFLRKSFQRSCNPTFNVL